MQGFEGGGLGRGGWAGLDKKVSGPAGVEASFGHKLADEPSCTDDHDSAAGVRDSRS